MSVFTSTFLYIFFQIMNIYASLQRVIGILRSSIFVLQVLSLTLDTWSDEEVNFMVEVGGNSHANAIYEAFLPKGYRKPRNESSIDERTNFIR